ncbi:yciC, partial [Symbiodinium necroappetens]
TLHPSMPWTFSDHCFGWLQLARPVSDVPDQSPREAALESEKSPRITAPEFYLEIADDLPPTHQHKDTPDAVAEIHANFCAFQEQNQIFAPAAPVPLPVLIVTGSLGSGKTTLMKRLMNRRANLRIAALAHDLASKINIDASFLAAEVQPGLGKGEYLFQSSAWRDGDVAGLSGCACCPGFDDALGLAVKTALREGADRGLLDYLLLETSGAADPRQIVAALEVRFGPLARARLDRVVTVVDAERVLAEGHGWLDQKAQASCPSRRREECQLQLAQLLVADVVLLNKVDICNDEPKALELLRQLCPHVKVLSCAFGDVPVPELLDVVLIFADGVSEGDLVDTRLALSDLTVPPTEMAVTEEIVSQLQPDFEMLESTDQPDGCVRFRLTGHSFFNISKDLDISEPPYRIDLDALNRDLAQIVNAEKGAIFLATGEGLCRVARWQAGRPRKEVEEFSPCCGPWVVWRKKVQRSASIQSVPSPPSPLPAVLAAARAEAPTLLQRCISVMWQVVSAANELQNRVVCDGSGRWHREMANTMQLHPKQIGQRSHAVNAAVELMANSSCNEERRPSFLRKTMATAIRGNEAQKKWKALRQGAASSNDVEESEPEAEPLGQCLPNKLSLSLGDSADATPRRSFRTTSSAVFDGPGKDLLSDVPLFRDCTDRFLQALSDQVHTRLVQPGTDIYLEGERGDSLFYLCRGEVEVLHGEEVQSTHKDGAVFGEMAAASKHPALTTRSATVRATALCDVKVLQRDDLLQVLNHFREDAKRIHEKVERHVEELREKGELPARKEWWRMDTRRSSVASVASATSEGCKPQNPQNAWTRAFSGMKLARRLSHIAPTRPHAYTMAMSAMTGLTGSVCHGRHVRSEGSPLKGDGALFVRQHERQASKSSNLTDTPYTPKSTVTSWCLTRLLRHLLRFQLINFLVQRSSAESLDSEVHEVSPSIQVLDPCESEQVSRSDPPEDSKAEQVRRLSLLLDIWSPKLAEAADSGELVATLKIQDSRPPPLPSLERAASAARPGSTPRMPRRPQSQESMILTAKLPRPQTDHRPKRRLPSLREQRQRAVNLHPFNQGGLVAGSVHEATRRGLALANQAALRVCRQEPINDVASRHQQARRKQARGSDTRHTACSKLRQPHARMPGLKALKGPKVWASPELTTPYPTTLWQDFQALRAQDANCTLSVCA